MTTGGYELVAWRNHESRCPMAGELATPHNVGTELNSELN